MVGPGAHLHHWSEPSGCKEKQPGPEETRKLVVGTSSVCCVGSLLELGFQWKVLFLSLCSSLYPTHSKEVGERKRKNKTTSAKRHLGFSFFAAHEEKQSGEE